MKNVYVNAKRDLAVVIAAYLQQIEQYTLSAACRPNGILATGDYDTVALLIRLDSKTVGLWSAGSAWAPSTNRGEAVIAVNSVSEFITAFTKVTKAATKSWTVGCQTVRVSDDGKYLIVGKGESTVTQAQVQEILDAMNPAKRSWTFGNRKVEIISVSGGKELSIGGGEAYVTQATVKDMLDSLKA